MSFTRISWMGAAALWLLAGCSSRGVLGGGEEPSYSGIQTNSMQGAPQARAAQNESRPLSELDTPDAIASREAIARNSQSEPAAAAPAPARAAAAAAPVVSAPAALVPSDPHQKNSGLQKGTKVRVRGDAGLRARPSPTSESVPVVAGVMAELGPQIYNAAGYWWYVTAGKDSGWLLQTDLLP